MRFHDAVSYNKVVWTADQGKTPSPMVAIYIPYASIARHSSERQAELATRPPSISYREQVESKQACQAKLLHRLDTHRSIQSARVSWQSSRVIAHRGPQKTAARFYSFTAVHEGVVRGGVTLRVERRRSIFRLRKAPRR